MKRLIKHLPFRDYLKYFLILMLAQTSLAAMSSSVVVEGQVGSELAAFARTMDSSHSGDLIVNNVPTGATILSATLYAHNWFSSVTPSATFAGNPLGSTSAFASDVVGVDTLEAYKWDVTSFITGNGTYSASASGFDNSYGLALVVVFSHQSLPFQRVVVNDGALQAYFQDTDSTSFDGFGVGSGILRIYTEADDTFNSGEQIKFNGNVVGGPIDNNLGEFASLFNIPVTTMAGLNTADIVSKGDHFGWHLAVLEGPAIPEPATMMLLGLGGLSLLGRKRQK